MQWRGDFLDFMKKCCIGVDGFTAYHLHMAVAGQNGSVIFGLPASFELGVGEITLDFVNYNTGFDASQEQAFLTGGTYLNFHTAAHPGGEVRGQVVVVPEPA